MHIKDLRASNKKLRLLQKGKKKKTNVMDVKPGNAKWKMLNKRRI